MTEGQLATLSRRGVTPEPDVNWVQASLLIDQVVGTPSGKQAMAWLRENGASAEKAAQMIARAEKRLRAGGVPEVRDHQRERRKAWAQQSRQEAEVAPAVSHANRMSSGRPPPRTRA
jgi:hypothetical protein